MENKNDVTYSSNFVLLTLPAYCTLVESLFTRIDRISSAN